MALTNWKTWASGDVLSAADMNTYVRDNGRWLSHNATSGAPLARVFHSIAQSTTTAVTGALSMDSERFDPFAMHDPVTNNSRLTVPSGAAGKYLWGGSLTFATGSADTARRAVALRVNGATLISFDARAGFGSASVDCSTASIYAMAAADYCELMARQDSGGALNVNASSNLSPEFYGIWLGE